MNGFFDGKWIGNSLFNGSWLNSNVMMIGLMGVLLLMASAVGRITATNLGTWLTKPQARIERTAMLLQDGAAMVPYAVHRSR